MFTLSMQSNIEQVTRYMRGTREQIALATAKALTFTAERVRDAERQEMQRVFDRPTPFTLNSLYLRSATPGNLQARVWFKDLRNGPHYLVPQVYGGERPLKRFEKFLQSSGWLPVGMYVVPGSRAALDRNGNIDKGELIRVLSALRALPQTGYLANRSQRSARRKGKRLINYFVGRPNPQSPDGIWQRVGLTGLRPIYMFVSRPQYQKRFRFHEIATDTSNRWFDQLLEKELKRATNSLLMRAAA